MKLKVPLRIDFLKINNNTGRTMWAFLICNPRKKETFFVSRYSTIRKRKGSRFSIILKDSGIDLSIPGRPNTPYEICFNYSYRSLDRLEAETNRVVSGYNINYWVQREKDKHNEVNI